MAEKTVKMDLPVAKTHKGIAYGPGEGIDVPEAAAEAFGKSADKAPKTAKQAKK